MSRRAVAALCLAVTLSACTQTTAPPASSSAPSSSSTTRATPSATPTTAAPRLTEAIARIEAAHPGAEIAVGWAPVGTKGAATVVGDPTPLIAWSTIKVPLALAVIRAGDGEVMRRDIDAALTASDNAAAERLWEDLGAGTRAARAVEAQLHRGRDRRTRVPAQVTVPGYSPFGQSVWRLSDQARFTATLPCLSGSTTVTGVMGRVVDGQRWGLGGIAGARFKGGWGSTPDGYVVRQLGIVGGTKGATALTLQVRSGTHEQGTAVADELAAAARRHLEELPKGSCD